ncbi:MAG: hypothetical protein K2N60_01490 [Oscillospiraceae bacterium]|nr:hypothetical protein [Oscillospiraceae bacterium]
MLKSKKFYSVLAIAAALTICAAGCSSEDGGSGEVSASVNVIGGDGASDGTEPQETTSGVILTDEDGEVVTGANGNALTEPAHTEPAPTGTINEDDILNAMTATATAAPQLNIPQTNTERYGYSTLTAEEKKLYDDIVAGIEGLRYKICDEDAYTLEEWSKIYGLVYMQEPRLFYMNAKLKVGKLFYLTKDASVINDMQKSIDAVADKLVAEANGKSTTFEKLKVFHDYLVLNSTFELKEELTNYNSTIYNALGSGEAQGNIQCAGYAKAMQYLCDKAGIVSMVVTGETSTGQTHAWNVVDVDGKWYNLDATWDDPILNTPNYKNIRYNFFLVPDSGIHNLTHMHVGQKKLSNGNYITYFTPPACVSNDKNYFVTNGLVYSDFASADKAIRAEIERAAKDGSRTAQIAVSSKDVYKQVYDKKMDYNDHAKGFSGVKGVSDECNENLLLIEFDVIYN